MTLAPRSNAGNSYEINPFCLARALVESEVISYKLDLHIHWTLYSCMENIEREAQDYFGIYVQYHVSIRINYFYFKAENFSKYENENPILAIKGAKVSDFGGMAFERIWLSYCRLLLSYTCAFIRPKTWGNKNHIVLDVAFCPGYVFLSRSSKQRWPTLSVDLAWFFYPKKFWPLLSDVPTLLLTILRS